MSEEEEEENITEALKRSKMIKYEEQRNWSDLIPEILYLIMQKLDYIDIIRCQSACKIWNSIAVHGKPNRTSPWKVTLCFNPNAATLETRSLYNLFECKEYPSSHQIYKFGFYKYYSTFVVLASNHGWLFLLVSYSYDRHDENEIHQKLFCYNPFTRKKKKLPRLDNVDDVMRISRGTFTADPTSSDCMFFLVVSIEFEQCLDNELYIYKKEDETWHYLTSLYLSPWDIYDVVYCNGFIYCIFEDGLLGAFDIFNKNVEMVKIKRPKELDTCRLEDPEEYLIKESYKLININEEILMGAFFHKRSTAISMYIFRLDCYSNMRWGRVECLDKYPFLYSILTAEEENRQFAGQIYNPAVARRSLIDIYAELNGNMNLIFGWDPYSDNTFEFWIEEPC